MSSILGDIIDDYYRKQPVKEITTLKEAQENNSKLCPLIVHMVQNGTGSALLRFSELGNINPKLELTLFPNNNLLVKILDE